MTKTHAEFLEELKWYLNLRITQCDDLKKHIAKERRMGYRDALNKIEQFQAEQKASDENS